MKKKILLVGGGGHCHSVLDSLLSLDEYDEIGIVEREGVSNIGSPFLGIYVVGTDGDLPQLFSEGWNEAVVTLGSVGNTAGRRKIYKHLEEIGFKLPVVIDKSAVIARDVMIEDGAYIGKNTVVNSGSSIGVCAIINTGTIVEHNCEIGDFVHISPGATVCGNVTIGSDSHIGAGTTVIQQISVGHHTLVGAGSVVVRDIPAGVKAYGNPCKVVSE